MAAQAPSLDTMHDPNGFSGVQTFANNLQSVGFFNPRKMAPQSHCLCSMPFVSGNVKRFSASNSANADLICKALFGIEPRPRHSKLDRNSNTSAMSDCDNKLPSRVRSEEH